MRSTVAKYLRKEARNEMINDKVPERDLVLGNRSVVNHPKSIRAMYLALKKAYKALRFFTATTKHIVERTRKACGFYRPQDLTVSVARIDSPLRHIKSRFPGTTRPDGTYEPSFIYAQATQMAKWGDGAGLQRLARAYI